MIRTVLFDCDGLMFDTEIVSNEIWQNEADKAGVTLPDDFFEKILGSGGKDLRDYLDHITGIEEMIASARKKRFDLSFWSSIHTDCLNKPGLIELFSWLHQNGYKTAICSSSSREYVQTLLNTVSVNLGCRLIIGGDMVTHTKPDPEIFLLGAKATDTPPDECLVLEDSKSGILAAKAAGMHNCFIQDTIAPDQEMRDAIEYERKDLYEVIELLKQINEEE